MEDGLDYIDPFVFEGGFMAHSSGIAIGIGYGISGFIIGQSVSVGQLSGLVGGVGLGSAALTNGKAWISGRPASIKYDDSC